MEMSQPFRHKLLSHIVFVEVSTLSIEGDRMPFCSVVLKNGVYFQEQNEIVYLPSEV